MVTTIATGAWVTNARWWTSESQQAIENLRNAQHFSRIDLISPTIPPSETLSSSQFETHRQFCLCLGNSLIIFSPDAEQAERNLELIEEMVLMSGCLLRAPYGWHPDDDVDVMDMKMSPYDITTVSGQGGSGVGVRIRPVGPGGNAFLIVDLWAPEVEEGTPGTPPPVRID
jgi:hypothetical protein